MALAADTIIHTLQGPRRVCQLAAMGEETYCFQWNGSRITVGRIFVRPEPKTAWTRRVVLDNGKSIRVTDDQVLLLRDGKMVDTNLLSANTSVMPLYIKHRKRDGHPMFRQLGEHRRNNALAPCDRKAWRSVARMVYEWATEDLIPTGVRVCHQDGNHENCESSNLVTEGKPRRGNKTKLRRMAERVWAPDNHRVIGQEPFDEEEVYDVLPQMGDTFAAGEVFMMGVYRDES